MLLSGASQRRRSTLHYLDCGWGPRLYMRAIFLDWVQLDQGSIWCAFEGLAHTFFHRHTQKHRIRNTGSETEVRLVDYDFLFRQSWGQMRAICCFELRLNLYKTELAKVIQKSLKSHSSVSKSSTWSAPYWIGFVLIGSIPYRLYWNLFDWDRLRTNQLLSETLGD